MASLKQQIQQMQALKINGIYVLNASQRNILHDVLKKLDGYVCIPRNQLEDFEPLIARHKNIQFQIRAKSQKESDALADNQMLWNKLTDKIKELLAYGWHCKW